MSTNPMAGLLLIALGAFSAASFYVPFNRVKNMAWEVYWLIGGFFSWIAAPFLLALITVPSLSDLYASMPAKALFWPFLFGILYGFGGLTFGLSMRYLGLSLGYALTLGIIAVFGTLVPPLVNGTFPGMLSSRGGIIILAGIAVTVAGIILTGRAGIMKDKMVSEEKKKETIREFNLKKGALVALFAGIMSACFAFGIEAGRPISEKAVTMGTNPLWRQNPVYVVMLTGTFITNVGWCLYLGVKNRSLGDFFKLPPVMLAKNYLLSAMAGTLWYGQFFLYGMGESKMGKFSFASWSILMALSIVFSTLWGLYRREWKGSGRKTMGLLIAGLAILVLSTIIIGLAGRL
jgi:L-rhamnose-H+ transport protein